MDFTRLKETYQPGAGPYRNNSGNNSVENDILSVFLSVVPATSMIALSITRSYNLFQRRRIVGSTTLKYAKLAMYTIHAVLRLELLISTGIRSSNVTGLSFPYTTANLLAALCMIVLSWLEHSRSAHTPTLFILSLLFMLLLDIPQMVDLWNLSLDFEQTMFAGSLTIQGFAIVLEFQQKTKWQLYWALEDSHQEEIHETFNLATLLRLDKLLFRGFRSQLQGDDLYSLNPAIASERLQAKFLGQLRNNTLPSGKFALVKALMRTLAKAFLLPIIPRISLLVFMFCQPFLLESLLNYPESTTKNSGYKLIGFTFLVYLGIALSGVVYRYLNENMMYMARGCLVTAIYRKTMESEHFNLEDSTVLTLMSTDVINVNQGFHDLHEFWANCIEIALASWMLARQLGSAVVVTLLIVASCAISCLSLTRVTAKRQNDWMENTEQRVASMANIVSRMKTIKISGILTPVENLIGSMRAKELNSASQFGVVTVAALIIAHIPLLLSPVMTFAITSVSLDIKTIFASLSYMTLLADPLTQTLEAISLMSAASSSLGRIQAFLQEDSHFDSRHISDFPKSTSEKMEKEVELASSEPATTSRTAVTVFGNFGWTEDRHTLKDLDITIPTGHITTILGPVASGKSTLCKVLLGEVRFAKGEVRMTSNFSRIGYCDQSPFLTAASIRENIVGFDVFDQARYSEVTEATLLTIDFSIFPQGDRTMIGSNGITLSGGQRQRVAMARALYLDSDFLIFDDTLSSLDAITGEQVFERVFGLDGVIRKRNATAVLATHSFPHTAFTKVIRLGTDGTVLENGHWNYPAPRERQVDLYEENAPKETQMSSCKSEDQPINEIPPHELENNDNKNQSEQLGEVAIFKHYLSTVGFSNSVLLLISCIGWGLFSNVSTIWLGYWSGDLSAEPRFSRTFYLGIYGLFQVVSLVFLGSLYTIAFRSMVTQSGATLHQKALRAVMDASLWFFTTTDAGFITSIFSQDIKLVDEELPIALADFSMALFSIIGMLGVVAAASPYVAFVYFTIIVLLFWMVKCYLRTSKQLRILALEKMAPLYTHFSATITGITTIRAFGCTENNIAYNNHLLDISQQPSYLLSMAQHWLSMILGIIVMVIAVTVVSLTILLKPSSHFAGVSLVALMSFVEYLTMAVSMYAMLETSLGALSRLKNLSENAESECLPGEDIHPPVFWPEKAEIKISGVSASYESYDMASPKEMTPTSENQNLVLRDLNIVIQHGERVAICGRTGCGKSSLLLLLLRLLDPISSCAKNIVIDEIPIHRVDRRALRRNIITIAQEGAFLPDGATFKENIDPFNDGTEEDCCIALGIVNLQAFVEDNGGINAVMNANSLSHGQRQLFCLARAIFKRNIRARMLSAEIGSEKVVRAGGLLLLDEISSNTDQATDHAMQAIIKKEFEGYTIVMVSHRLEMVMDFDRVIVMDQGRIIESGCPRALAKNEGSRFWELWRTGMPKQASQLLSTPYRD